MTIRTVVLCDRCKQLKEKSKVYGEMDKLRQEQTRKGMYAYSDWLNSKMSVLSEELASIMSSECSCKIVYQDSL